MAVAVLKDETARALELSRKLHLECLEFPTQYFLTFENDQWVVRHSEWGSHFQIRIDFLKDLAKLKLQRINPKKDLLCRALGFQGQDDFTVLDGTFGVGKDAVHLLACGAKVFGVERHPITFCLVESAWASQKEDLPGLQICNGDIEALLSPSLVDCKQALYLDPMFENAKQKSAPKKMIAFLRELEPEGLDVQGVIEKALRLGLKRVVVKRPLKAAQLNAKPSMVFRGKLIRYDVYTR